MESVLFVDDDTELCNLVTRFLAREGFDTTRAATGSAGVESALGGHYSLIMLDVMLPDTDGFSVLARIREHSRTPVLMLTARGDTHDRIRGLEMGADDYLPKPFDPAELVARIRAILRRSVPNPATGILKTGDVDVDAGTRTARCNGAVLDLTTVEFDLLNVLIREAGTVVSRADLVQKVLGRAFSPFDRSIDTHVCNLRKKLGPLRDGNDRIRSVRGSGYLYAAPTSL